MTKRTDPTIRRLAQRIKGFLDDPEADLDDQIAAAREWVGLSGANAVGFQEALERIGFSVAQWLLDLPGFLVLAGRPADAQAVVHEVSPRFSGDILLANLAVTLAENGHAAAARVEIEASTRAYPDDAWVAIKCGDALRSLGDAAAAEREYRRGLALADAEDDALTAEDAVDRLARWFEELGREADAKALWTWFEGRFAADIEDGSPEGGVYDDEADDDAFEPVLEEPVRRDGPKVGRNDPCPCGSGRKYKKCCAAAEDARSQDARRNALARMTDELVKYGDRHVAWENREDCVAAYFGRSDRDLEESFVVPLFVDWLHLDVPAADGLTCAESYRERRGARLPADERALLDSLVASHLGLYEVTEVRPGEGVTLRHVLFDTTHEIAERLGSRSVDRRDLVAARLVAIGGRTSITSGALLFPPEHRTALLERLRGALGGALPTEVRDLRRAAGIFQQHLDAMRHAPPPGS